MSGVGVAAQAFFNNAGLALAHRREDTHREYRKGQPTGRIFSPVAITGYVPDVLRDVSMVANDFDMQAGTCGKGWKELVPVGSGGPHLRTRCRLA